MAHYGRPPPPPPPPPAPSHPNPPMNMAQHGRFMGGGHPPPQFGRGYDDEIHEPLLQPYRSFNTGEPLSPPLSDISPSNTSSKQPDEVSTSFEGYRLLKNLEPQSGDPSWSSVYHSPIAVEEKELLRMIKEQEAKGTITKHYDELKSPNQRLQVDRLIEEKRDNEKNPNAQWVLVSIKDVRGSSNKKRNVIETKEIQVILKRQAKVRPVSKEKANNKEKERGKGIEKGIVKEKQKEKEKTKEKPKTKPIPAGKLVDLREKPKPAKRPDDEESEQEDEPRLERPRSHHFPESQGFRESLHEPPHPSFHPPPQHSFHQPAHQPIPRAPPITLSQPLQPRPQMVEQHSPPRPFQRPPQQTQFPHKFDNPSIQVVEGSSSPHNFPQARQPQQPRATPVEHISPWSGLGSHQIKPSMERPANAFMPPGGQNNANIAAQSRQPDYFTSEEEESIEASSYHNSAEYASPISSPTNMDSPPPRGRQGSTFIFPTSKEHKVPHNDRRSHKTPSRSRPRSKHHSDYETDEPRPSRKKESKKDRYTHERPTGHLKHAAASPMMAHPSHHSQPSSSDSDKFSKDKARLEYQKADEEHKLARARRKAEELQLKRLDRGIEDERRVVRREKRDPYRSSTRTKPVRRKSHSNYYEDSDDDDYTDY